MIYPQRIEIGWFLIILAVVGLVFLAIHHFWPERRRMLPVMCMLMFGTAFLGCVAWYFWLPNPATIAEDHVVNQTFTTASEVPDVILRFVYPDMPALVLINQSNKIARDIKWSVALWNIDDPRTYINPGAAPNAHDPLPIPVSTFDFLRPHAIGGPQALFNTTLVLPYVKPGQRLVGSASVVCPECGRGHTYLLYIIFGQGGWYTEVADKKEGELIIPHHLTKELVANYYNEIVQTPDSARIPIEK